MIKYPWPYYIGILCTQFRDMTHNMINWLLKVRYPSDIIDPCFLHFGDNECIFLYSALNSALYHWVLSSQNLNV